MLRNNRPFFHGYHRCETAIWMFSKTGESYVINAGDRERTKLYFFCFAKLHRVLPRYSISLIVKGYSTDWLCAPRATLTYFTKAGTVQITNIGKTVELPLGKIPTEVSYGADEDPIQMQTTLC